MSAADGTLRAGGPPPRWLILAVPLYFIIRHGVIAREERYLQVKFGDSYLAYSGRVRRWI